MLNSFQYPCFSSGVCICTKPTVLRNSIYSRFPHLLGGLFCTDKIRVNRRGECKRPAYLKCSLRRRACAELLTSFVKQLPRACARENISNQSLCIPGPPRLTLTASRRVLSAYQSFDLITALYRSILAAAHWMLPVACLLITCTLLFERLAKAEEA